MVEDGRKPRATGSAVPEEMRAAEVSGWEVGVGD